MDSLCECINTNYNITFAGFGTFVRRHRNSRTVTNYLDGGTTCAVPDAWVLKFIPGGNIKRVITSEEARVAGMDLPEQDAASE